VKTIKTIFSNKTASTQWKKGLKRSLDKRFVPKNYGFGNAFSLEWKNKIAHLKSTGPKRFECGSAAQEIKTILESEGLKPEIKVCEIKTLPCEIRNPTEEDFGSLRHLFVGFEAEGKEYHVGVTPLDRRILKIYPVTAVSENRSGFLLEGEHRTLTSTSDQSPFWNWDNLQQYPMEWFMSGKNLVYLFAGFHLEANSRETTIATQAVVFRNNYSYPETLAYYIKLPWRSLDRLAEKLRGEDSLAVFFAVQDNCFEFDLSPQYPADLQVVHQRSLNLIKEFVPLLTQK